jgi:N-acetylglucosaminyl-diphospho-decaprenol L-rhamnosyltransferase
MDAVIVTHNSAHDLRALIAGATTVPAFSKVVVVDNASTDDTRDIAARAGLEVLAQDVNRGFAHAVNLGVARTEGPAFAVMNPDVRLAEADLDRLAAHLGDEAVGAVAPALVLPGGEVQDSARRVPSPLDLVVRRFTGRQPDAVRGTGVVDVDWAVAACLVIRRRAFDSVSGFDGSFFLYFEDVDFGVRLRAAGYRVRYDPTVRVSHDHRAASRSSLLARATRHHVSSATRFYARNPRYVLGRRGVS